MEGKGPRPEYLPREGGIKRCLRISRRKASKSNVYKGNQDGGGGNCFVYCIVGGWGNRTRGEKIVAALKTLGGGSKNQDLFKGGEGKRKLIMIYPTQKSKYALAGRKKRRKARETGVRVRRLFKK